MYVFWVVDYENDTFSWGSRARVAFYVVFLVIFTCYVAIFVIFDAYIALL